MCTSSNAVPPACAADALSMLDSALGYLATCDAPGLGAAGQSEALAALERAEAIHTAARARILSAFGASRGFEADGHYGPKPWLRAITRVSKGAAAGAAGWARRLQAHPAVAGALAAGAISASWAKEICSWTDLLPEDRRGDADQILLAAASGGADLHDLAALAREMAERSRTTPDNDGDRDFTDRQVRLDVTFGGAGQLAGDLTPGCAAALSAVLDALSGKMGPEDTRTLPQRRHDALEEALQRLIAARMVPGRHGEPVHVQVHVDLAALRGLPGASGLEAAWSAARATAGPGSCYLTGAEAEAAACDATIIPVVTGQIDGAALDQLTEIFLHAHGLTPSSGPGHYPARHDGTSGGASTSGGDELTEGATGQHNGPGIPPSSDGTPGSARPATPPGACGCTCGTCTCPDRIPISPAMRQRLQHTLLQMGTDLVSGPGGLASYLRARLLGRPYTGVSQPLDLGAPPPRSLRTYAARSSCGTSAASSRDVSSPPRSATCITSSQDPRAAQPRCGTAGCSADFTTSSSSTGGAGP
ncbi:MAG TPA: DUF222 domain-containing protein [Streptosporangiaceae bacterium]|nr:DUF222 domain-containing protein [Streptosporangiaceae bacterium]